MENREYLSVLSVAASSGSLTLTLTTYDSSTTNVTIVAAVTGITSGDSETTIARKVMDQVPTILIQNAAKYSGVPSLIQNGPLPTFRLTRTEHVVCFYSECQFDISVTNPTGCIVELENVFITTTEALDFSSIFGLGFDLMTAPHLSKLLSITSSRLVNMLNNPIVISTYRHDENTKWRRAIRLNRVPIVSVDKTMIRYPDILPFLAQVEVADINTFFDIDHLRGWIEYKFSQESIMCYEPFDYGNSIRLSYTAGYKYIPQEIKSAIIELAYNLQIFSGLGSFDSLKGGTFSVTLGSDLFEKKAKELSDYQLGPNLI